MSGHDECHSNGVNTNCKSEAGRGISNGSNWTGTWRPSSSSDFCYSFLFRKILDVTIDS
jgi:hypothetical protein